MATYPNLGLNQNVSPKQFASSFQMQDVEANNNGGLSDATLADPSVTLAGKDAPVNISWMERDVDPVISSSATPMRSPSEVLAQIQKPPDFQPENPKFKT